MADPVKAQAEAPYPTGLYVPGHPDLLSACARLHGLEPRAPEGCRYLDLGCGEGTNALAVAASLPQARCLGLDLDPAAIDRGRRLQARAGIDNAELRVGDLRGAEVEPAAWDYVVLHGILSWVPYEVRQAAFALAAHALAPGGVVMASYNALPGWLMLEPARRLGLRHARRTKGGPHERVEAARGALARAIEINAGEDAYSVALEQARLRWSETSDFVLMHDDLASLSEPLGLAEVAQLASAEDLNYIGEAFCDQWWEHRLSPSGIRQIRDAAGPDALTLQEEADACSGVPFKATIFATDSGAEPRGPDWRRAADLHLLPLRDPTPLPEDAATAVRATAQLITDSAPLGLSVAELQERAGHGAEVTARAALRHLAEERAWPSAHRPRFAYPPPEHPEVPMLAREVAMTTGELPTLSWDLLPLGGKTGKALVALLDGTRDLSALASGLMDQADQLGLQGIDPERLRAAISERLDELARAGAFTPASQSQT
ncbi:MAG: methyltransferase domain-containing protein [Thermoleophilia bacterium]|nr:methyltransferase domain-containing protein [Thermoleophilia bacterium]